MVEVTELERIELFAALPAEVRALLARRGRVLRFEPGAVLWRQGDAPRGLFVVLEGEVRVVRDVDGRRRVVHAETAGGTLGEVPLFEGTPYPATALAARRSACAVFERDAIHEALRMDPALAFLLLARLSARVRHLIDRLERLGARSVTERLAAYLEARATGAATFTLGATQQEVAEEIGTVREVVVRELRALRAAGILATAGRGRYRVADPAALGRLAQGRPAHP